jgi:N-methylhydantoinase A
VHRKFHERHATIYAYATEDDPVEVVNLRVTSVGQTWKVRPAAAAPAGERRAPEPQGARPVYFGHWRDFADVPVYDGAALAGGDALDGPAIVELPDTSIVVDDRYDVSVDAYGNFRLQAKQTD